jgi:hypothetical protein
MNDAFIEDLNARHNSDGGWGAVAGAPSDCECTALAVMALHRAGAAVDALSAGEEWLLIRQEQNGSWRYRDDGPVARWATPVVMLALNARQRSEAVARGMTWLVQEKGEQMPLLGRIREFLAGTKTVELDTTLDGWPWAAGTFAWVEPTSWALMAIKAAWGNDLPRAARGRVSEGEEMLLDRACPDGGWNYGNKRVLDVALEPYPDTTAIALLGLHGHDAPQVEAGFAALDRLLGENASGLALSLAALSARAWGRDTSALQARIMERYEEAGFLGETRTLALAALATESRTDWFGVNADHE